MATLDQQIKCAKDEIERRKKELLPLVQGGKYPKAKAMYEIECMRAIFQTLSQLKGIMLANSGME